MARSIRLEFEGSFYHVMARANRCEPIFLSDEDRRWFLQTLGEACAKTGWRVHAWVLMDNHYLAKLAGSDWRKVALARLISAHTTTGHQWLADNLKMRSAANVSQVLRMKRAEDEALHVPPPLHRWIKSERVRAEAAF